MTSLPADPPGVIVGVDTHQDVHVAVALDALGRRLGELQIAATTSGYGQLVSWVRELGPAARFGVEGTGSYGAGLHRYLRRHGLAVVEVNQAGSLDPASARPERPDRRRSRGPRGAGRHGDRDPEGRR
jgi:transposase